MKDNPRGTVCVAAFILLCFFLPWIQVSCAGIRDSASGLDLARGRSPALWIIPATMVAVIGLGLIRSIWVHIRGLFSLASFVSGGLSATLMWRERLRSSESSMVASSWTTWFWLGSIASALLSVLALQTYAKGGPRKA